jgi:2,3-bisphosphoglycerate-dependent phosphoglycerate mutase
MKTIWLIRHAHSTSNAGAAGQDPASIALSPLGQLQAQALLTQVQAQSAVLGAAPASIHVSAFGRTLQTAQPCITAYPSASVVVGLHHELTYLSPAACIGLTAAQRSTMVQAYWQAAQPDAVQGAGAESFAAFMHRVAQFDATLAALPDAWHLVFGHGQFLWAYALHRCQPYPFTEGLNNTDSAWMLRFRQSEVAAPIANTEHLELRQHRADEWFSATQARDFLGDDPELLAQLQSEYQQQLPKHIAALRASWWAQDAAGMAAALHAVRPMTEILCIPWLLARFDALHHSLHSAAAAPEASAVAKLPLSAIWALGDVLAAWQSLADNTPPCTP